MAPAHFGGLPAGRCQTLLPESAAGGTPDEAEGRRILRSRSPVERVGGGRQRRLRADVETVARERLADLGGVGCIYEVCDIQR